jgi:hypothetical protein
MKICSNNQQKIIEMEELGDLLTKNYYPQQIIQKEIEKFEKYKMLNVEKTIAGYFGEFEISKNFFSFSRKKFRNF